MAFIGQQGGELAMGGILISMFMLILGIITNSNMTINATDIEINFGLFGHIGPGSEVKDLALSGLTVNAPRSLNVGGVVGYNDTLPGSAELDKPL